MKTIFSVITIFLALAPAADAARGGARGTMEEKAPKAKDKDKDKDKAKDKDKDKKKCRSKDIPNNW
jgi:Ni/Co efflux regulator RcnB